MAAATSTASRQQDSRPRPEPIYRLFTDCPQDWLLLVVRGGDLYKIVHSVTGWRVNDEFEFVQGDEGVTPLRALLGVNFVGIPPFQGIYQYRFAWNKFWRKREDGQETAEYGVQAHAPEIVYLTPFEAQYPLIYAGIEVVAKERSSSIEPSPQANADRALIPITFVVTVRVRMLRPRVALMTNYDWFGSVLTPNFQKAIRDFAGHRTYEDLIRQKSGEVSSEFSEFIMGTGASPSNFRSELLKHGGIDPIDIGITDIRPNETFEQALLNLANAQINAQSTIVEAEARRKAKILDSEGDAKAIRNIAEADEDRLEKTTLKAARAGIGAVTLEKWRQVHGSGLTTYVEAGAQAGILVGADGRPISS